jgi:magnesium transporter
VSVESDAGEEQHDAGLQFKATELDVLVGRNLLATIHRGPLPFKDELEARTATNPQIGSFDADYLLYVLLDSLLDHYAHELDKLQTRVNQVEERLLTEPGRAALNEALILKRQIHKIRRVVSPHREAFSSLSAPDSPVRFRPSVEAQAFRDLLARLEGLVSELDHARDLALGSYSLYISNVSHRTNEQLKVLTILSAVLLPLSVVVGLFGTNFKLPEYESLAPFYVMLIGMVVMACGMLAFFRWRRWL